jgi:hypothetical protein
VTAEEMQDTSEDDVLAAEEDITDQQILAINQMCKRVDINLTVYVKKVCDEVSSVREVSNLQGRVMLKSLAAMQRKRSSIEENIIGYDANWRENFDAKGDKK